MTNINSQFEGLYIESSLSPEEITKLSSPLSKLSQKDLYIAQACLQQCEEEEKSDLFVDSLYMMALVVFGKQVLREKECKQTERENKIKWSKSLLQ